MKLGEKIKEEMKERQMTLQGLSKKTGISIGNLSYIVNSKNLNPGILTVDKIAKEFGKTLDQLLNE